MNGVIVVEGDPPRDGTRVRVETMEVASEAVPRTPAAVLKVAGTWQGSREEMDELLTQLREMKWAEVDAQRDGPV